MDRSVQRRVGSWVVVVGIVMVTAAVGLARVPATSTQVRSAAAPPARPADPTSVPPTMTPGPPAFPRDGLEIRRTTDANGWVVLPDAFGVWVAGAGTLTRIDPRTGATRVTAHGRWDYDFVRLAEYGEGTIFVASGQRPLLEMDAGSGTVIARIDVSSLGSVDAVVSRRGEVWATASGSDGSQVLARIDPDTGKVERLLEHIGQGLHVVIGAERHLFVGSHGYHGPTMARVDPRTMEVDPIPDVPPGAGIAAVGPHVWVTERGGIGCLDTVTLRSCGHVDIPGFVRLASFDRDLWVVSTPAPGSGISDRWHRSKVLVIDGRDGRVLAGPLPVPGRPSSIASFGRSAWLGYYRGGNVIQVDRCRPGTCHASGSSDEA
jgi:hypothetical protein